MLSMLSIVAYSVYNVYAVYAVYSVYAGYSVYSVYMVFIDIIFMHVYSVYRVSMYTIFMRWYTETEPIFEKLKPACTIPVSFIFALVKPVYCISYTLMSKVKYRINEYTFKFILWESQAVLCAHAFLRIKAWLLSCCISCEITKTHEAEKLEYCTYPEFFNLYISICEIYIS